MTWRVPVTTQEPIAVTGLPHYVVENIRSLHLHMNTAGMDLQGICPWNSPIHYYRIRTILVEYSNAGVAAEAYIHLYYLDQNNEITSYFIHRVTVAAGPGVVTRINYFPGADGSNPATNRYNYAIPNMYFDNNTFFEVVLPANVTANIDLTYEVYRN